ncbi:MAG TPA: hypothetical protein VNS19_06525 [Acidimicrobiales bacterium]|nr:hypothetical protein [Acidimicrobiales bacterium]
MTTPTASPTPTPAPTRRREAFDRRTIWLSALVLFGSLVVGIVLMAVFADPGSETQPTATDSGAPHIIDRPNSGHKPTNSGDRGGWEQLALLGGMVVVIGGIGFVVFKGGAAAKANRDQWKAAGESGRDGALRS